MKRINLTIFASILSTLLLPTFVSSSVFLDDNNTNWDAGTLHNMKVYGTGGGANISSSGNNVSGHFASQIFDSGSASYNWTNITIRTEIPYGTEIGRAFSDSSSVSSQDINDFGFINTSGLVLLLHFNNESAFDEATSEAGLNNKTVDFSVYVNSERSGSDANNGSFFGGATINKTNYKLGGGAVEFDGTDDYIKVSRDGSLDPGGTNVLTISAWVKRATSTSKTLVAIKRSGGGYVLGVGIHGASTNQIKMTKYGKIDIYLGSFPQDTNWHHLVGVWDGSGTFVYIDGELDGSGANSQNFGTSTNGDLLIGGDTGDQGYGEGTIDEVTIWNISLSATEIKNHYKRGALRLNLSVRSCDDSACAGDAYQQVSNLSFMGGKITNLSSGNEGLSTNRYFQYNLTYSRDATGVDGNHTIINNVTIEYDYFLITKVFPSLNIFNSAKLTIRKGSIWGLRWI